MTGTVDESEDHGSPGKHPDGDDSPGPGKPDEEAASPGQRAEPDIDAPVSEEDALLALLRGGGDEAEHAESELAAAIAQQVAKQMQRDPAGLRIRTLALFNDSVSFGGGFNIADHGRATALAAAAGGLRRIDEEELARHVEFYLSPPGFQDALGVLRERHLVVLPSPPGTGRKTAAYNLLAETLATCTTDDAGGCYMVAESAAVGAPGWEPRHRNSGYLAVLDDSSIIKSPAGASLTVDTIDERWVVETAARVKAANSFMIVVTDPARGALVETASRSEHVLPHLGSVDPVCIVERRVLGLDPEPEEVAALHSRLADTGALTLLRERPEPRVAVSLALVIRSGGDLEAEVRSLGDPSTQVHSWFSRHRDPEALCFVLAAATLADAGYLTVSDAAVELYRSLTPDADRFPDLRFRERLGANHPWIDVSVLGDNGHAAFPGPPRVRFRNPLMPQAVLGYAWTGLDGRRSGIQEWLRRLITHPDIDVRARAAVAAGVIAWSDHDHAMHRYLRSWAGSSSTVVRQAAATALDVVGGHPDLTAPVWALLESWASEENTQPFKRRLAVTAAMAAGGTLGGREPQRATEVLRIAMDREDWGTLLPVTWSLVHLIEQDRISDVLSAMLDWSEPQDSSPLVTKALSAFAFAVSQPATERENGASEGRTESSAALLPVLLAHAREFRAQLEELWARALARKPAQTQALEALRECLGTYGNRDRTELRDIQDILLGVAARPGRHRERLEYHLGQWAHEDGHSSDPAARIHAALARSKR